MPELHHVVLAHARQEVQAVGIERRDTGDHEHSLRRLESRRARQRMRATPGPATHHAGLHPERLKHGVGVGHHVHDPATQPAGGVPIAGAGPGHHPKTTLNSGFFDQAVPRSRAGRSVVKHQHSPVIRAHDPHIQTSPVRKLYLVHAPPRSIDGGKRSTNQTQRQGHRLAEATRGGGLAVRLLGAFAATPPFGDVTHVRSCRRSPLPGQLHALSGDGSGGEGGAPLIPIAACAHVAGVDLGDQQRVGGDPVPGHVAELGVVAT